MAQQLAACKQDLRIVRLSPDDAARETDRLDSLRQLVLESEDMYPGIKRWLKDRVVPGLRSGHRAAFLGYSGEQPIASAISKRGERTKFCHVRVHGALQDLHLGETFFSLMAIEARHEASEVHFTLPESVWEKERLFFASFGFDEVRPSGSQYRLFDRELHCSAEFPTVWRSVLTKLPKISAAFTVVGRSLDCRLLMSVRAEFAFKILAGAKSVEVRRRFSEKWSGARVTLYASHPTSALIGEATIGRVVSADPATVWREFGCLAGCSRGEYYAYIGKCDEVSAIFFDEVRPFASPVPLAQLNHLVRDTLRPPQSFCTVDPETSWGKALALAGLLHARFTPALLRPASSRDDASM